MCSKKEGTACIDYDDLAIRGTHTACPLSDPKSLWQTGHHSTNSGNKIIIMNAKLEAQDAASWYLSHLDPYCPHEKNCTKFLRGALLAVTWNALYSTPLDPAGGASVASKQQEPDSDVQEEKKSTSSPSTNHEKKNFKTTGVWRDFLLSYDATMTMTMNGKPASPLLLLSSSSSSSSQSLMWNSKSQQAYDALSRRTKARMEAFLAGCILAVPSIELGNPPPGTPPAARITRKVDFSPPHNRGVKPAALSTKGTNRSIHKSPKSTLPPQQEHNVELQDGLSGFQVTSTTAKAPPNQSAGGGPSPLLSSVTAQGKSLIRQVSNNSKKAIKHPQIPEEELVLRLELYIRSLQRIRTLKEECVVAMEPPKAIKARARYVTSAFVATAACLRSMSPGLTRLLTCLTKEVLAVDCLSETIVKAMKKIVMEYEHGISFASLAFLSSPEGSADTKLTPLIVKYLKHLQCNWEELVQECELERMLSRTLDPKMRRIFKTIEFRSIGHLLEVCHEHRHKLHNIELIPENCGSEQNVNELCNSTVALRQAIRDLQREIITVNGHVLPPVTSRKDLIHLLSQTLNSRTLTALPPPKAKKIPILLVDEYRRSESCPSKLNEQETIETNKTAIVRPSLAQPIRIGTTPNALQQLRDQE